MGDTDSPISPMVNIGVGGAGRRGAELGEERVGEAEKEGREEWREAV